jgi:hypothetical protein
MDNDVALDIDAMKADLAAEIDEALELADRLALEVVDSPRKTATSFQLARAFQEKRIAVRRLRRVIKAQVAG